MGIFGMKKGSKMKHGFCRTKVALGVALFLGSGAVWAAGSATSNAGGTFADSLNTTLGGGSGPTSIGNSDGTTINGNTLVSGTISATGTVSGNAVSAGAGGLSSIGGAQISGSTTTISSKENTISGEKTTISSSDSVDINTKVAKINGTDSVDIDTKVAKINGTNKTTVSGGTSEMTMQSELAQTTVKGTSTLTGTATMNQMSMGNAGQQGVRVDANGKMSMGTLDQSTAALTVTNGQGNTHGFVVNETSATMSGGTTSTSLTLDNGGARFSSASTGGPVRVTGVADGRHDYDAVNYRQLKSVKSGIAGIAAMTNVPHVEQNKKFALGIGIGHYDGMTSMAVGASARLSENAIIKASVSNGVSGGSTRKSTVYGVGAGFSW
jgi:hypothetical protein